LREVHVNPIKNKEQFAYQVQQTLDDLMDLRASVEYDEEYMGDALSFLDPVEEGLRRLADDLAAGNHRSSGENLSFIDMLEKVDMRLLPFRHMLVWINEIQRDGFAVEE
jgi:hypothetical protein